MLNKKFTFKFLFFPPVLAAAVGTFVIILLSLYLLKTEYTNQQAEVIKYYQTQQDSGAAALSRHQAGWRKFDRLYRRVMLSSIAGLMLMLGVSFLVMLRFINPMHKIVAALKKLAYASSNPPDLEGINQLQNDRISELSELANAVLSFHDALSDRHRVEKELRKLSLAVDQSPSGIMITDLDGKIEYVNQAFLHCSGYEKMEVLGRNPRFLNAGNTPDSTYDELWKSISSGHPWMGELINRRKDGGEYIEANTVVPIKQADGSVSNYLAIKEDVTEKIKVEVELLRHRDHLAELVEEQTVSIKAIVDTAADGIITIDQRGKILSFNTAAEEIFGYSAKEITGQSVNILMPEPHRSQHDNYMRRYLESGEGKIINGRAVVTGVRRDGSTFPLSLAISAMEIGGEKRFTVIGRDISAEKEAERALIASREAAEAASRAKGDFLANMSHEIRTPMNAVIGLSHLCLQTDLDPKQREYLEKVHHSARSLLRILNDILDFSKIEAGRLEVEEVPFGLDEVLGQLKTLVDTRLADKKLEFKLHRAAEVPPRLLGDPLRLGQVLINLVGNAVKFTEEGEIGVEVEVEEAHRDGVSLRFTVRDTGIGMSSEQCARIFQSFSQADTSITRKYGGTGLGLAISRQLVGLMGGNIRVESAPGRGSSFIFTLPFGKAEGLPDLDQNAGQSNLAAAKISGAHLLLAEDDEVNRLVARELLARVGVRLSTVENGALALERLAHEEFDGVLLDLQMPVMDGISAAKEIRKQERFKKLPIIALTANAMSEDMRRCLEAGIDDHIGKPIEPETMVLTLSKWISPTRPQPLPQTATPQHPAQPRNRADRLPPSTFKDTGIAPQLPGVLVKESIKRLNGDPALYYQVLRQFQQSQSGVVDRVRQALTSKDMETAERLAHTLKGLSGTIGAVKLEQMAAELEHRLAQRGEINHHELLLALAAELHPLLQAIGLELKKDEQRAERAARAESPPSKKDEPLDQKEVEELINQACGQLEDFDSGVEETIAKLRETLQFKSEVDPPLKRLTTCLEQYDYEQALKELSAIARITNQSKEST